MVCHEGSWKAVQKDKRGKSKAAPCVDAKAEDWCSAEKGHCNQYTDKRMEMERDVQELVVRLTFIQRQTFQILIAGSCDQCRCQDSSQWNTYCPYWSKYCNDIAKIQN